MVIVQSAAGTAYAQSSAFTYQGQLTDGGIPATNIYEMQFKLFDTVLQAYPIPLEEGIPSSD